MYLQKRNIKLVFSIIIMISMFSIFTLGCSDSDNQTNSTPAENTAFIVTTDFATGSFSTISLDSPRIISEGIGDICSDAVSRYWENSIYVVGRYGCDSISVLNPTNNYSIQTQFSVGAGTNPQDIVVIDSMAYVSRFSSSDLLVINPSTGETIKTIDLSSLADDDGYPEMGLMYYIADYNYLFVEIQRIDTTTWTSVPPSYLAVIDTVTDLLVDTISLQNINPVTDMKYDESKKMLYVGCTGSYGVLDGGIEEIDVENLVSNGNIISESQLAGDVLDFEIFSDKIGYALIADSNFITKVVLFDPSTATVQKELLASNGYDLYRIKLNDRGELWVIDRTVDKPAIHIFNASTGVSIETILLDGLPPFWINFIP